jgi:hypothetical protein
MTKTRLMLFTVSFVATAFSQKKAKGWHEFVSMSVGYVAVYPEAWYLLPPKLPTLRIGNFPPSRAVKAVVLPPGGALISILPARSDITSIEQWAAVAGPPPAQVVSRQSLTLRWHDSKLPFEVAEMISTSLEGQESVLWCFRFSGRLLEAHVTYWQGDSNAVLYRRVLGDIVERLRPLSK